MLSGCTTSSAGSKRTAARRAQSRGTPPAHLLTEGATLDQQVRAIGGGGCAERRVQRVPLLVLLPAQPGGVAVALRDVPAVPAGADPRRLGPCPRSRHTAARPPVRRRLHHVSGRRRMRGVAASRPAPWPPGVAPLLTDLRDFTAPLSLEAPASES